ncbi:MAG: zinc-binding dehydrogenase [Dyadobacter sp.]|uniref:zinc-binding dehydrogenase n=1 Tax=Dyadobacter sp. TaxID=1914288 RepID=UPI003265E7AC
MKAIVFHQTGGPQVHQYEEVPTPQPAKSEVLIRVEAAGVNFADITRRKGTYYPEQTAPSYSLGAEVVGKLNLQIGAVLPLSQAAEAHRLVEGRHSTGKAVLTPWN